MSVLRAELRPSFQSYGIVLKLKAFMLVFQRYRMTGVGERKRGGRGDREGRLKSPKSSHLKAYSQ